MEFPSGLLALILRFSIKCDDILKGDPAWKSWGEGATWHIFMIIYDPCFEAHEKQWISYFTYNLHMAVKRNFHFAENLLALSIIFYVHVRVRWAETTSPLCHQRQNKAKEKIIFPVFPSGGLTFWACHLHLVTLKLFSSLFRAFFIRLNVTVAFSCSPEHSSLYSYTAATLSLLKVYCIQETSLETISRSFSTRHNLALAWKFRFYLKT